MNFTKLVPNVYYIDINDALSLFVDCLQFKITHDERTAAQPFCVIEKNGLAINLFQNEALAKEHNPEFRLVTDDIAEVYRTVSTSYSRFLHPNLKEVALRILPPCPFCGKPLRGRSDKKFCDPGCKNQFNNVLKQQERQEINKIDLILKHNRRILRACLGSDPSRKISRIELLQRGLNGRRGDRRPRNLNNYA